VLQVSFLQNDVVAPLSGLREPEDVENLEVISALDELHLAMCYAHQGAAKVV
jgi:hypothetical protein